MSCKHRKVEGNTTKYFICKIFDKTVDDYKCQRCLMRIEDKTSQIKDLFGQLFGKGFGN